MVKNPTVSAEDVRNTGLIPGLGRYPGEGNDNPFQYSCLKNPSDRRACWVTIHRVSELNRTEAT